MRQGRASRDVVSGTKVEPKSKAVSPEAVALMGAMRGNHSTDEGTIKVRNIPLYQGRGLEAPMKGKTSHPKGSQGQY